MIVCRGCGANCDPADIRQGLCDDCRSPEVEFRKMKVVTDRKRQQAFEEIERSKNTWRACMN